MIRSLFILAALEFLNELLSLIRSSRVCCTGPSVRTSMIGVFCAASSIAVTVVSNVSVDDNGGITGSSKVNNSGDIDRETGAGDLPLSSLILDSSSLSYLRLICVLEPLLALALDNDRLICRSV